MRKGEPATDAQLGTGCLRQHLMMIISIDMYNCRIELRGYLLIDCECNLNLRTLMVLMDTAAARDRFLSESFCEPKSN